MANASVNTEARPSRLKVAASVSFYIVAAIAMILANKWVLNETDTPVFFLFCQLVVAVLMFVVAHVVGLLRLPRMVDAALLKGLAPMITVNVLGLNFNNFCLKYVDASFYQVARGLVLPFTVVTSLLFLHAAPPSRRILLACGIVTGGFFTGVFLDHVTASGLASKVVSKPDSGPSALGVFFGILSSMSTALQAVVIKRALDVVDGSAIDLAWYTNLLSAVANVPIIILAGEVPAVLKLLFGPGGTIAGGSALGTFLWGTAVTGIFGFLICVATLFSIKITSPITHMVSSAVRGVIQTFFSVWIFHDVISLGRGTSITLILAGSVYYTWVKHVETQKKETLPSTSGASGSSRGAYEPVPMDDLKGRTSGGRED
ncbi:GDP-fucose transporter 1 [Ceratobasidium theobromae]|uniref:GDP-fucose transporter 1 n=1 Tax=Ceratobasidium theobromae TaxID=1582974 RepID=A0A5N5QHT0_9AGAM|nr:GDP-fucose transporter 1 [Ceratobasidium theobromae]